MTRSYPQKNPKIETSNYFLLLKKTNINPYLYNPQIDRKCTTKLKEKYPYNLNERYLPLSQTTQIIF